MSDLEEISAEELLSQSDGEIQLSEPGSDISQDEAIEDGDDEDISDTNGTDNESDDNESDDESTIVEDDPWVLLPNENEINISEKLPELSNEEDESDSEYDDDELKKLDRINNSDIILNAHPEIQQINYKELSALSKITRDKDGSIIDPLHRTIPFLTRYEKAKTLGLRAKQINDGSEIFINVGKDIIDGHTIALMELKAKKIPFIIKRPLPFGNNEYWKLQDLELID